MAEIRLERLWKKIVCSNQQGCFIIQSFLIITGHYSKECKHKFIAQYKLRRFLQKIV